jgi:N-acetylneuraminic acid mutarotase
MVTSCDSLVWSRVEASETAPRPRSGHSAVIYNHAMYIFGGLGEYRYNDLFRFDFSSCTWTEIKPVDESTIPSKRCKHSACVYQNMMYIFGGWDSSGKLNDMHRYVFERNTWELVPCTNPPAARSAHSVAIYQSSMYLFGGIGDNKYNDMYRFSFKKNQWSMINQRNAPPRRSSYGGAHIYNDRMYIVCGLGCGKFNDCHMFDFASDTWTELKYSNDSRATPSKRGRHTCVLVDDILYMFGGYVGIHRSNELFLLNLRTNQWQQIASTKNFPAAREGHSAVFYNESMWLFGGWHENGWYNDIYTLGPL